MSETELPGTIASDFPVIVTGDGPHGSPVRLILDLKSVATGIDDDGNPFVDLDTDQARAVADGLSTMADDWDD